jgi:hypothetical protein
MDFAKITSVACGLALAACSNLSTDPVAHDELMVHLSDPQRAEIDEARAAQAQRGDELAFAREVVVRAKAEKELAETDLELAKARVESAEARIEVARTGSAEELQEATDELHEARARLAPQEELIHWHAREIARCEKAALLAERELELAEAHVGLAKARAFVQVDQATAQEIDVAKHEARVNDCQRKAEHAAVELQAAERDCALALRNYDEAVVVARSEDRFGDDEDEDVFDDDEDNE